MQKLSMVFSNFDGNESHRAFFSQCCHALSALCLGVDKISNTVRNETFEHLFGEATGRTVLLSFKTLAAR